MARRLNARLIPLAALATCAWGCSVIGGFDDYNEVVEFEGNGVGGLTPGDGDMTGDGDMDGDGDGDGDVTIIIIDSNGDGVADDLGTTVDINMDGRADEFDINRDTILDGLGIDTNGDGLPDAVGIDTDGDGVIDALDSDGDGFPDIFTQLGGGSGDGDFMGDGDGGPPGAIFSQCMTIGGDPGTIFDNDDFQLILPLSEPLAPFQDFAIVPSDDETYIATAINGETVRVIVVRRVPVGGNQPGPWAVINLPTAPGHVRVLDGVIDNNQLYLFGLEAGQITQWRFDLDGTGNPVDGVPDTFDVLDSTCTDPLVDGITDGVAFDARSAFPDFAFTCLRNDSLELRLSSTPGVYATTDTIEPSEPGQLPTGDTSLMMRNYVRSGNQHLVVGDFSSNLRAGTDTALIESIDLKLQNNIGDSFTLGATPGPDNDSAILFGLHVEGGDIFNDHKNLYAGVVHNSEFMNLGQSPLPFLVNTFGFTTVDAVPQRPKAFGNYIALSSVDANNQRLVTFSVFNRSGQMGFAQAFVYDGNDGVENAQAAPSHSVNPDFFVAWVEGKSGTDVSIRGQALQCQ